MSLQELPQPVTLLIEGQLLRARGRLFTIGSCPSWRLPTGHLHRGIGCVFLGSGARCSCFELGQLDSEGLGLDAHYLHLLAQASELGSGQRQLLVFLGVLIHQLVHDVLQLGVLCRHHRQLLALARFFDALAVIIRALALELCRGRLHLQGLDCCIRLQSHSQVNQ